MNTNRRCSGGCVSRKALNLATSCYARRLTRRRKSNEGGLSRDQTSRYTKIDIFFPVHGSGDYVWSVVGNKCSMLNVWHSTRELRFSALLTAVVRKISQVRGQRSDVSGQLGATEVQLKFKKQW